MELLVPFTPASLGSLCLLLISPGGQIWDAAGGKEKDEVGLWLLPCNQQWELQGLLLLLRASSILGSLSSAAHVARLQQALCHFPCNKQAKEKGPAIPLPSTCSPRANDCPMFLWEVMDCSTGISRPRVSGKAAVSSSLLPA